MVQTVTLANAANKNGNRFAGMSDLAGVIKANAMGVQIYSLREFNRRLLETHVWEHEKSLYPAYSSKFFISEQRCKRIGDQIVQNYVHDNIRRVADLKMLGLSQYIGEMGMNVAFFVDQNPILVNGKPNLYFANENGDMITSTLQLRSDSTILVMVNDPGTIQVINHVPSDGETLNPSDYKKLVGVEPTERTNLKWYLSGYEANLRLLGRDTLNKLGVGAKVVANVLNIHAFGVQGEIVTGAQAPAAAGKEKPILIASPSELKETIAGVKEEVSQFGNGALQELAVGLWSLLA